MTKVKTNEEKLQSKIETLEVKNKYWKEELRKSQSFAGQMESELNRCRIKLTEIEQKHNDELAECYLQAPAGKTSERELVLEKQVSTLAEEVTRLAQIQEITIKEKKRIASIENKNTNLYQENQQYLGEIQRLLRTERPYFHELEHTKKLWSESDSNQKHQIEGLIKQIEILKEETIFLKAVTNKILEAKK